MYVHARVYVFYVCMYVCMYVRMYVCLYVCLYVCIHDAFRGCCQDCPLYLTQQAVIATH